MNRERDDRRERSRRSRSPDRRRSRSRSRSAERRRIGRDRPRSRERERRPRDRSRSRSRSPPRKRSPTRRRSHSRSPTRRRSRSPARRTSRSRSRERDRKNRRRSRSRSRSSSSSSSDRDSDRGRRRHRRRSRSRSRERKDKDKKRKHRDKDKKKSKSKSKSKKKGTVASEWGKFGIINESDLYTKDPEFRTWLLEERKINPETISKDQTRKQFAKFVEDFNTGTLPHEKYYNLARYEARMSLVRSGEALPADDAGYDFGADVAAHASAIKRTVRDRESEAGASYSREELQELRRVQNERVQLGKMKVLGMDIKTSMGVRMVENDTFDGD